MNRRELLEYFAAFIAARAGQEHLDSSRCIIADIRFDEATCCWTYTKQPIVEACE